MPDPTQSHVSLPIGRFFKALATAGIGGKTLDTRLSSYDIHINWSEPSQFGGILTAFHAEPPRTDAFFAALTARLETWEGIRIRDLPDDLTFDVPSTSIPEAAAPFSEIIPGVPNPGVDPRTGDTPIDDVGHLLDTAIGAWLPLALALVGGVILVYIGFKYVMNANASAPTG